MIRHIPTRSNSLVTFGSLFWIENSNHAFLTGATLFIKSCHTAAAAVSGRSLRHPPRHLNNLQQKFRVNKQELEVMFDVEPSSTETATDAPPPPQCTPPSAEIVALLNTAEVRLSADDGVEGGVAASGEVAAEGGQKVTPWEVEVSWGIGHGAWAHA